MTFSATGSPPDNPRIRLPIVGLVPVEHDAMAAALHRGPQHGRVSPRPDADALRRTAQLDLARRRSQAVPGRAEPRRARPEDGREPEWDPGDDIVQQLFAIGLAMHTTGQLCGDRPELAARITGHMNDLQLIIQQIRSTVLDHRPSDPSPAPTEGTADPHSRMRCHPQAPAPRARPRRRGSGRTTTIASPGPVVTRRRPPTAHR